MIEDNFFNWEKVFTILIGIVIVALVYIIISRRRKIKQKNIEREADFLKNNEQKQSNQKTKSS